MKKYIKFFFAALALVLFVGTFIFLWLQSRPKQANYSEISPTVQDLKKTTIVTGKIEPRNEVNVKPQISGIITHLYKQAGQRVEAGEVIARVKVIPDMTQLSAAQDRLRLANINLQQATVDNNRMKTLWDKGLVAAEEYEKTRQLFLQAKQEQTAARHALEVVRDGVSADNADQSSTLVRSTISGLVLDVPVKVGNTVILSNTFNDGTTIATVADMSDLIFRGNVDETDVASLVVGMPMRITIGAMQGASLQAQLEYIAPKAVETNGANQFEIKAAVHGARLNDLRAGYGANAEIVLAEAHHVLTLPEEAVEFQGGKAFVYVAKGDAEHRTYERRSVVTGLSDGMRIAITSGLKTNEKVRGAKKDENAEK